MPHPQFRLHSLFILTAIVAVGCAILVKLPVQVRIGLCFFAATVLWWTLGFLSLAAGRSDQKYRIKKRGRRDSESTQDRAPNRVSPPNP